MATHQSGVGSDPVATSGLSLADAIHSGSLEVLNAAVSDPTLSEDLALALLRRNDLAAELFEQLSKNATIIKSRKAKLAIIGHPKAPRYVSMALLRQVFTFDLMRIALVPVVPGDVKVAAEEVLIKRMESISSGERLSLARQGSARIAGALLSDTEPRVIAAALENPRLTDTLVIRAVTKWDSSEDLIHTLGHHPKWSVRREVRIALLRNQHTPLVRAVEFSQSLAVSLLKEILRSSRLPADVKACLLKERVGDEKSFKSL